MEINADIASEIFRQKQSQDPAQATVSLPSGNLVICESAELDEPRVAKTKLPAGDYPVHIYYLPEEELQELDASPTVGIDAIVVGFSDKEIVRWEEVTDDEDEPLVDSGNLIDFVIGDQNTISDLEDDIAAAMEDCYTEGFEACGENAALAVYVGEVALEHKFFWAFDADSKPAKLFGVFAYPEV